MSRRDTVVEQKHHFLQLRKQFLSRGIVPSENLKRVALEGGIGLSVLKGALDKGMLGFFRFFFLRFSFFGFWVASFRHFYCFSRRVGVFGSLNRRDVYL